MGDARPLLGPLFVIFMQLAAKILPNNRVLPQTQVLAPPPPSGKSWIRRWFKATKHLKLFEFAKDKKP